MGAIQRICPFLCLLVEGVDDLLVFFSEILKGRLPLTSHLKGKPSSNAPSDKNAQEAIHSLIDFKYNGFIFGFVRNSKNKKSR